MESKATEVVEALGGFWTIGRFEGQVMGQAFSGVATLGFDPTRNCYVTTWVDSMMPQLWFMEGNLDEGGKSFKFEGPGPDFTGEGTTTWKIEFDLKSDDEQVMRMFAKTPDGSFFMTMENTYHRRK